MTTFGEISKLKIKNDVIKSISFSQDDIFKGIIKLYCNNGFELDPCYSKGNFYKKIPQPKYRFDIDPQFDYVKKVNSVNIPLKDNSINSIIFDPPFYFGIHGKTLEHHTSKRYTMFKDFKELEDMYKGSLKEFYRILKKKGKLIFKIQDYTDSKTTMTHCLVFNWASNIGFYAKDMFILLSKSRMYNPNVKQRHSRKFHCYFFVFEKI